MPVYIVSSKLVSTSVHPRPHTPNIYNLQPDDDVMMFGHQMRMFGQMLVMVIAALTSGFYSAALQ